MTTTKKLWVRRNFDNDWPISFKTDQNVEQLVEKFHKSLKGPNAEDLYCLILVIENEQSGKESYLKWSNWLLGAQRKMLTCSTAIIAATQYLLAVVFTMEEVKNTRYIQKIFAVC